MNQDAIIPSSSPQSNSFFQPWMGLFIFFCLLVLVINGVMAYLAVHTWNGLVTSSSYDEGNSYNKVLEAQKVQDALGWRAELRPGLLRVGQPGELVFILRDRNGAPVVGAQVVGSLYRLVQAGHDQEIAWREQAEGRYLAMVTPSLPGQWELKLSAVTPTGEFRYAQRIQVQSEIDGGR